MACLLFAVVEMSGYHNVRAYVITLLMTFSLIVYDPCFGQDFFMVSNSPELKRRQTLYIYALSTSILQEDDVIEFNKEPGRLSGAYEVDVVKSQSHMWGCFMKIYPSKKQNSLRYGMYNSLLNSPILGNWTGYTFAKRESGILNTRGVFTTTVYPPTPEYIGVKWSPGCRKLKWHKEKGTLPHTGQILRVEAKEEYDGVYTISRGGSRKKRGWFVQIRVIIATCPRDSFYNTTTSSCMTRSIRCLNGGVGKEFEDRCICPMLFFGEENGQSCIYNLEEGTGLTEYPLVSSGDKSLLCEDLEGSNSNCRGLLVCHEDLFGCKCAAGWMGNNCDEPCHKGFWGQDCSQRCPTFYLDCDRFRGPIIEIDESELDTGSGDDM